MKLLLPILLFILYAGILRTNAQCNNNSGNINDLPVCGQYGDANGNSNWNWELDKTNPSYCSMWYARTDGSNNMTLMGSPFVDPSMTVLSAISDSRDFTRDKGWELLRRDFGCSHVTAFPYFVLYNRYSGLMRVFVYMPAGQTSYSGIAIEITPNLSNAYPATTAFSDTLQAAPDRFLVETPTENIGRGMVAIGQLGGLSRWSLVEFTPSFDPFIHYPDYAGTSLQFTIYGVTQNDMYASIKGGTVTSSQPIYNFTYKPTQAKTPTNDGFDFKGVGEKFTKFTQGVTSLRTDINNTATSVVQFLDGKTDKALVKVRDYFEGIKKITATADAFDKAVKLTAAVKAVGSLFGVLGTIVGIVSGSSSQGTGPTYTNYDLVLQGKITTKVIVSTFVMRVPGTIQNNNDNATYYKCPLGILNIKNTPEADVVTYPRTDRYRFSNDQIFSNKAITRDYVSYRIRDNIAVSFNDGAGLDLVSVQAAIVGEIQPKADGTASYDLFEEHDAANYPENYYRVINHMRADFEIGRLEIKNFDTKKGLHIIQTPFTNVECLNGLAFNALATTKVYLQVKAVLKKKNDPSETPIVYIQNYQIRTFEQTISDDLKDEYKWNPKTTLPPYANYTEPPLYKSDLMIYSSISHISPTGLIQVDNTISTLGLLFVQPSSEPTNYVAGGSINLEDGFEVLEGSEFSALPSNFGYTLNCATPKVEAYSFSGNCYNTTITALRTSTNPATKPANETTSPEILKVYPVPTSGKLVIDGIKNNSNAIITILDQSGRSVKEIRSATTESGGQLNLDVSGLSNGIYFIKIQTLTQTITRKIVVSK
jgi:hypothetical protein